MSCSFRKEDNHDRVHRHCDSGAAAVHPSGCAEVLSVADWYRWCWKIGGWRSALQRENLRLVGRGLLLPVCRIRGHRPLTLKVDGGRFDYSFTDCQRCGYLLNVSWQEDQQ